MSDRRGAPGPRRRPGLAGLLSVVAAGFVACGEPVSPPTRPAPPAEGGPRVRAVGTVQDGGLPHAACVCPRCEAARADPALGRRVASLALVLPEGRVFLIDATPDLRGQLDALADVRDAPPGRVDRSPIDGVLLTHAHLGHYTGLAFLGFEAVHAQGLPVYCSPRMAAFLRANGPWSQLVELGNVELREVLPGEGFELGPVSVTPLAVPHRDEYSDTLGFVLRGPRRRLLYVPDTDSWNAWTRPIDEVAAEVDVAILDGTFFSTGELPGRDVASIGHPLITDTLDRLEPLVRRGSLEVYFTHLNHSNPALDAGSPERREIERRSFAVLAEGQEIEL